MTNKRFTLVATVDTDNPESVTSVLQNRLGKESVKRLSDNEFRIEAQLEGEQAKDLNRSLLSELRRAEKKTRLRAEWTSDGITERFFDYVLKKTWKRS